MALAQCGLAALAGELETNAGDDLVYGRAEAERVQNEGTGYVVGFCCENEQSLGRAI